MSVIKGSEEVAQCIFSWGASFKKIYPSFWRISVFIHSRSLIEDRYLYLEFKKDYFRQSTIAIKFCACLYNAGKRKDWTSLLILKKTLSTYLRKSSLGKYYKIEEHQKSVFVDVFQIYRHKQSKENWKESNFDYQDLCTQKIPFAPSQFASGIQSLIADKTYTNRAHVPRWNDSICRPIAVHDTNKWGAIRGRH